MARLILFLVGLLSIYFLVKVSWLIYFFKKRSQGLSSGRNPTMFDVRALLKNGQKEKAVKIYQEIFKVSLSKAMEDVDQLEQSISGQK